MQLKDGSKKIGTREFLIGEYVTVLTDTRLRWSEEERGCSVVLCNTGFEKILVFGERGGTCQKVFFVHIGSKMIKLISTIVMVSLAGDRHK